MDQKNTAALWRTDEIGDFYGPGAAGLGIAPGRDYETRVKLAAFIVQACNAHDQLVSALTACLKRLVADCSDKSCVEIMEARAALTSAGVA